LLDFATKFLCTKNKHRGTQKTAMQSQTKLSISNANFILKHTFVVTSLKKRAKINQCGKIDELQILGIPFQ